MGVPVRMLFVLLKFNFWFESCFVQLGRIFAEVAVFVYKHALLLPRVVYVDSDSPRIGFF